MDKELFDQLMVAIANLAQKGEEGKSVASQDLLNHLNSVIMKRSEELSNEKADALEKVKAAEAAKVESERIAKELTDKLAEQEVKFNELQTRLDHSAAQVLFNGRMETLSQNFTLDDELRKIFADDLKALPADEASFASYLEKHKVLLKGKEKSESDERAISVASELIAAEKEGKVTQEDLTRILASANIEVAVITNSQTPTQTFAERFANAEGIVKLKK